jgi:two-component system response regulator FlrC
LTAAALTAAAQAARFPWLPGLAGIELRDVMLVEGDARPAWRHVHLSRRGPGQRSRAIRLGNRLDLAVAPGDAGFAVALIAAFAVPAGQPVAAAATSRALLALAARVAGHDLAVLIAGPTGTGKEGLARLIHRLSPRRDCPFVAVNCAALPETMLEAALFGHERGAFTGAIAASPGLFRAANGGTLFLDEIAELPLALQAKLLRALQEREVLPVGATRAERFDARLVAASNRDPAIAVAAGDLRADLFHRLAGFPLETLPLAHRVADVPVLVAHFLLGAGDGRIAWPDAAALARLCAHAWPGNVRELGNVVARARVLADTDCITPAQLLFDRIETAPLALPGARSRNEAAIIRAAVAGAQTRRAAAASLGISERALRYKLAAMQSISASLQ